MPERMCASLLAFNAMVAKKPAAKKPASRTKSASESEVSKPTKREPRQSEVRQAIDGRQSEFSAIAFMLLGIIVGLAVYLRLAGPVGRGADTALGSLLGLGRYLLPPIFVAVGITHLRGDEKPNRMKLVLGWGGVVLSALGILHVVKGPDAFTGVDELGGAGGWLGALLGQTLGSAVGAIASVLILVAAALGCSLLITSLSLKDTATKISEISAKLFGGASSRMRSAAQSLSTLSSDHELNEKEEAEYENDTDPTPPMFVVEPEDRRTPEVVEEEKPEAPKPERKKPTPEVVVDEPHTQGQLDTGAAPKKGSWKLPPVSYLTRSGKQAIDQAEVDQRGKDLEEALRSHGVEVRLVDKTVGPTVTRFELELGAGVKVARVTSLQKDIAYAMAATDVRILAPIPGKSAIGIEVPNKTRQLVSLGDLMTSNESKIANHPLDVAMGKDIAGRSVFLNLATTPHLLIAGATGAGKSSGINCIITSILMRATPDQVKLILIDPKQVEMGQYARLPHLLTQPVTNPKKAANALAWAVKEMEKRYDLLFEMGYRDITGFNAAFDRGEIKAEIGSEREFERMHYIVVVVDELNDLMMVAARDVEESITRIAQKARAVGIHLIVATQRPSVNVITGVIKANVPARAAFAVSSQMDSRVILDQIGAEKLVGKGDMLLLPGNSSVAQRIQGCWVDEEEVRKVVAFWRQQAPTVQYVSGVEGEEAPSGGSGGQSITDGIGNDDSDEALLKRAMELVVRSQMGSTSMLQRKLGVGFARAGRLMDLLEQNGIVGPSVGSKAREVLMTVEEFEAL
jgi:S-DNA-T family DNA segregation ATPase FtsK/SpoIIIE